MASLLTEQAFNEKMDKLNSSQQAIETTSAWCSLWSREARSIVGFWEAYFSRADMAKRLSLIYLANDIIQNTRKKGPEFAQEFYRILPRALRHYLSKADEKGKASVIKVIKVWEDRKIFGDHEKTLHQLMDEAATANPPAKKRKTSTLEPASAEQQQTPKQIPSVPPSLVPAIMAIHTVDRLASAATDIKKSLDTIDTRDTVKTEQLHNAYLAKLREEMRQRDAVIELLQTVIHDHEDMKKKAANLVTRNGAVVDDEKSCKGTETAVHDQDPATEAAALAAQLVENPEALFQALSSLPPNSSTGQGNALDGGVTAAEIALEGELYDPEEGLC